MDSVKRAACGLAAALILAACSEATPQDMDAGAANANAPSLSYKEAIIQRAEAYDATQYTVLGFYPGMRRDEAFAAVEALDIPFNTQLDSQASIYAVQRMNGKTLEVRVDFAEPITGWDNAAARAHTITLNVPFPGDERVVADETNADLAAQFGTPLSNSRNSMVFAIDPDPTSRTLAAQCERSYEGIFPSAARRPLTYFLSQQTEDQINTYCPELREAFIAANAQHLAPRMVVKLTPGRRDINYMMHHPLVSRNSAEGEKRCEAQKSC